MGARNPFDDPDDFEIEPYLSRTPMDEAKAFRRRTRLQNRLGSMYLLSKVQAHARELYCEKPVESFSSFSELLTQVLPDAASRAAVSEALQIPDWAMTRVLGGDVAGGEIGPWWVAMLAQAVGLSREQATLLLERQGAAVRSLNFVADPL